MDGSCFTLPRSGFVQQTLQEGTQRLAFSLRSSIAKCRSHLNAALTIPSYFP
uniref:Uncharacterized protein n=1 Tax=Vibrio splendidus TaxID=29497 RepID=A0A0H3ZV37_VIBSP|nr:hypothetical protein [Vibrio splendidus]